MVKSYYDYEGSWHFLNYEFCIKLKWNSDCGKEHLNSKQQGSNY